MFPKFQSTLPQGEWRFCVTPWCTWDHFNPHSHKGSDCLSVRNHNLCIISIHTPTRGVTGSNIYICWIQPISIHTPTRGVTCAPSNIIYTERFQSTLPQGEWRRCSLSETICQCISIHTPTRGVTAIFTNNYISILSLSSKVTFQNHL